MRLAVSSKAPLVKSWSRFSSQLFWGHIPLYSFLACHRRGLCSLHNCQLQFNTRINTLRSSIGPFIFLISAKGHLTAFWGQMLRARFNQHIYSRNGGLFLWTAISHDRARTHASSVDRKSTIPRRRDLPFKCFTDIDREESLSPFRLLTRSRRKPMPRLYSDPWLSTILGHLRFGERHAL